MNQEQSISEFDLIENLSANLESIFSEKIIYLVIASKDQSENEYSFVLGPLEICGSVLGLYDEEYGWPTQILFEEVKSLTDIAPSRRRHPFIFLNGQCVAISIYNSEYQKIKKGKI